MQIVRPKLSDLLRIKICLFKKNSSPTFKPLFIKDKKEIFIFKLKKKKKRKEKRKV